jgi:TonB family protein
MRRESRKLEARRGTISVGELADEPIGKDSRASAVSPAALTAVLVAICLSGCAQTTVRASGTQADIQEPLGWRAPVFAEYVVAMHRRIHKLFTLGFLADIDARKDPAYADQSSWTQLEIAVKADGSIERVAVLRRSGLVAFDVAAIISVLAAAPFAPPPQTIASADGRVYVDWQFHRDERACGAFGADPHIYRVVGRKTRDDLAESVAKARARLTQRRQSDQSEARVTVYGWFAAYLRRDQAWLAGLSAVPFTTEGEVIALDAATLKKFYGDMVAAKPTGDRVLNGINVLTPSDIRNQLGNLPPGGESPDMLYAVGHVSGEELTLLLKKSNQGWRVCGLNRRPAQ